MSQEIVMHPQPLSHCTLFPFVLRAFSRNTSQTLGDQGAESRRDLSSWGVRQSRVRKTLGLEETDDQQ